MTQLYDEALRPVGLRVTQFSLLSALHNDGPMTVADLARGLGADTTSTSRALATISKSGWVRIEDGPDKRSKSIAITPEGKAILQKAYPYWQTAQAKITETLGEENQQILDMQLDALSQRLSTT